MNSLPLELQICPTQDGSPTILFSQGTAQEKMHSSQGALSESLYIYGQAITKIIELGLPLKVLSVGLGLGYNELITCQLALNHGIHPDDFQLSTYEANPFLLASFQKWVLGQDSALNQTYNQILTLLCDRNSEAQHQLLQFIQKAASLGSIKFFGAFPGEKSIDQQFTCVLYDAYCAKTSPELWEEDFLKNTFSNNLAEQCIFSTYAAKGSLNRALNFLNFKITKRQGFAGKRECTWALKGIF